MIRIIGWIVLPIAMLVILLLTFAVGIFDRSPHHRRNQLDQTHGR